MTAASLGIEWLRERGPRGCRSVWRRCAHCRQTGANWFTNGLLLAKYRPEYASPAMKWISVFALPLKSWGFHRELTRLTVAGPPKAVPHPVISHGSNRRLKTSVLNRILMAIAQ